MPKKSSRQPELLPKLNGPANSGTADSLAHLHRPLTKVDLNAVRHVEGFPIGVDEDIIEFSDPPYYTACPNPFLDDFIRAYGKPYDETKDSYHREPFAADVSEAKSDPIYNAHSYHTKVPYKAIMRYILHYTNPGDIVFDGFCGTGMTGIAAQMCGKPDAEFKAVIEMEMPGITWGARRSILCDLSPAATYIAYNYNTPVDLKTFERNALRMLAEVESECGWMYETAHADGSKGQINYTVWSEVFNCPQCSAELAYYDVAVNKETHGINDSFHCPACHTLLDKRSLGRMWISDFDVALNRTHKLVKYKPVLINYQLGEQRFEKAPDVADLRLLTRVEETPITKWYPVLEMLAGERKLKDGYHLKGITHLHHFYFPRALRLYALLWHKAIAKSASSFVRFFVQGNCLGFTKMNRYSANYYSQVNRYFSGTLFVGSLISEVSPQYSMTHKLDRLSKLKINSQSGWSAITCQSATSLPQVSKDSIDYIFVDPPFGNNLHYSELNFFWEAWLRVLTQREPEAVMDRGRNRTLGDYQELMIKSFQEMFRVLKPGRWMTVEFHNSQNKVWNAIQEAILRAGFVVADVRTLDKQQETYKQSIQKLVKQDLVISAYKPRTLFEERFIKEAGSEKGAWEFVRQHLQQLPIFVEKEGALEIIAERQNFLLFDRMVAFHIQRGASVPLSAGEFYAGLHKMFPERDGMYFLSDQVAGYDAKRVMVTQIEQLNLFVSDERSAVQWLRLQLEREPQTRQYILPEFLQELHQARHEQLPDLTQLLEENFLKDSENRWYVPDPGKDEDLEKLRERGLFSEFETYRLSKGKLKTFRTEAVRAGFKAAWSRREYTTITEIARRLPEDVLQEDPALLMYYDNAAMRSGNS